MKGLLKNNFYGVIGEAKILLLLFLTLGIALLVTGSSELFLLFAFLSAPLLIFNSVSSLSKAALTKWVKYELTMPVQRKDIIKSRYISHSIWSLLGVLLPSIFVVFAIFIHGNKFFYHELRDPIAYFCVIVSIALYTGAFFYPAVYSLGAGKSELLLILSLIGAIGLTAGLSILLYASNGSDLTDTEFLIGIAIFMVIAIIVYILSYFLTVFIYSKKEY